MTLYVTRVVQISVAGHEANSTTYAGKKDLNSIYFQLIYVSLVAILGTVFTHVPKH